MSEIVRKRAIEAEGRRQVMREQELALRRGNGGLLVGSTSLVEFNSSFRHLTRVDNWSMAKRIVPSFPEREMLSSRHECNALMAPRQSTGQRISEVKPEENISGLKRKDESPWYGPMMKKVKTEWNC